MINNKSAILIVERNLKIVPDLDLKLFINKTNHGWKVYDFGFWDFRYTKMKRGLYLRYLKKDDIEGLINHLNEKIINFLKN
ncbi:ABC cobalamin-Fe3+-siderophore transporter periplasmic substrate-binding subunit protein [Candidatus Micropelagos thuwalensis]|uniref:ABC cobalamin-Fe3+-siderophore transporter periplasmic substrate-binding subunit protein n=1 Tax=Candidatus Micropelagius thuwalensis TaxID=1397666 RepID=U2XP48_9PROT|nr:ABC cobalamin-Fe3+-siderophore transporter periplasmic substrate-binding subunit protein [Candidatus Micropelagos thuwalensis]